ncbi:competence type IV pilus major pilin ComGC [Aciduricibacillus chroicocephali]|uniref:ComG operon protein 3 n=2 Tax=Aciduricibacillus chroicocephali TaxID=3054939 RepID=A0ABY9KZE4_9BACI|nr:competence type IV pilus major pilin ComGC [Bacillaceae bacterium 44XB]
MRKGEKGFTLIEMLIVLLIIAVLILLIIPNLAGKSKEVNKKGCMALKSMVQSQVTAYELAEGKFPANLDELVSGGYIEKDQKSCSSKQTLQYDSTTGKVTVSEKP